MDREVIVFAQEHYNPLNIIRALGKSDIRPVFISIKRNHEVASKSKYISKLHHVNTVEDGYNLLMGTYACEDKGRAPYVLFSDDKCIGYFDARQDEWEGKIKTFNAGRQSRINEFMDKYRIQQLAKKCGFNVLESYIIMKDNPVIPDCLSYPVITKDISPNSGKWKGDVYICRNETELLEAISKIESPSIMIQRFVDKKNEMALEGYAINHGNDLHIITQMTWKYLIQGYYSPFHDVVPFNNPDMEDKIRAMFKEIGFEGIFEVEFLIDKDGTPYFMEINFRASAWNPTCFHAGMPLPNLWIKGMENGYIDDAARKTFEPFTSMSEIIDYGKRVDGGLCSIGEWLKDFREAKCLYIYDEDDIGPWEEACRNWEAFK